jgi:uncharacterized SAM-binding protein YcdF (DUF218 family)
MARNVAPTLVFAGSPDTLAGVAVCRDPQPFEVICLTPENDNTRNEARATGRLAEERHWKRLLVVTTRYHVARTRLLFGRCVPGEVDVIGEFPHHGADFARRLLVHEWVGLLQATTIARGC